MSSNGAKIVLAASDSESSEYLRSTWRQMLLACLPARYAHYMSDISFDNEVAKDGQAKYVPHGLRIIESMKLMNEIECEVAGVIESKLVMNGQPVEYGEALFAVRTV